MSPLGPFAAGVAFVVVLTVVAVILVAVAR